MDADPNRAVMVTGGRGFVGRAVVRLLKSTGARVISLDQNEPRTVGQSNEEVRCDITDRLQLLQAFGANEIGSIIHLAAVLPTAAQCDPIRATRVNVKGSALLLEMARLFRVGRIIFGSSLSIYGSYPANCVVSEADRTSPEDLYGAAKLYVERLGAAIGGFEFASLRIGRVVGPGAQSTSSAWRSEIFEKLGSRESYEIAIPYRGSERVLLAHVDDVAGMLVTMWKTPDLRHAVYNAPCESMLVCDLKMEIERLNPRVTVTLGAGQASGNPRQLDASRFEREFGFRTRSISERLRLAAEELTA